MPTTVYGDGSLYGDADAIYGRIAANLMNAQLAQIRETGLRVSILDERINQWEHFTGVGQDPTPFKSTKDVDKPWEQTYWSYRAQADICVLDNGTIVRVRNNVTNRSIQVQEITDASVASQWTNWTTYNADQNYAVAIAPDGNDYIIYHAKSDGLYRNNSKVWDITGLMRLRMHRGADGRQVPDFIWAVRTSEGIITDNFAQLRKFDLYLSEDVVADDPTEVDWNWVWQRHTALSIEKPDGRQYKITAYPLYAPATAINSGDSIAVTEHPAGGDMRTFPYPRLIRGVPGDYGHNTVANGDVFLLNDGYYYLLYNEVHVSDDWEFTTNVQTPLVWQRSKDLEHWSEPVHIGFNAWGMAGLVEDDDYVYLAGNGEVYRRPNTPIEYALDNYVPQISWESPRENQSGSGNLVIANPESINDFVQELNDRRLIVEPGIKTIDGQFEYAQLEDFWLGRTSKEVNGDANRLVAQFGTIWNRLENPMRDTMNFIGRTTYEDFMDGRPNEMFAYFFEGSEGSVDDDGQLSATGNVLWTGWKGYNPDFSFNYVTGGTIKAIFRYLSATYHCVVEYDGSNFRLYEQKGSDKTLIGTHAHASAVTRIRVRAEFKSVKIYVNSGALLHEFTLPEVPDIVKPGYVGFGCASQFFINGFGFSDLEFHYTAEDLIRQALALGDYHDVIIGGATEKQFALTWGPQTDIPTAADALRNLLEAGKLELVWRGGFIQVGRFTATEPLRTLEDQVIETQEIDEANRRINLANVDGNEDTWMEVDTADALQRGRMINAYYDLPELLEEEEVRQRAIEEIRRGKLGQSPGGSLPLQFDLWRMDPVTWVDNQGNSKLVRIEGISVQINQSTQPSQRMRIDTSLI